MDSLSIKGIENVAKFIDSVSDSVVQVLVSIDEFQTSKPNDERFYTVEIVFPNYSGEYFEKVTE